MAEDAAARPALQPLITTIVAITLAGAGLSLSIPLLALRLEEAGYSAEANGVGTAVSGLATLFFAPFVPTFARLLGMRGLMLVSVAASILSLAALAAVSDLRLWYPIRGFYSCALTGLFVPAEFAINAIAPPDRRGLWIGVYSTCLALGFAAGPLLLGIAGTEGLMPFFAGMALFVIAALPIAAYGRNLPELTHRSASSILTFLRQSPGLLASAFVFGAIETGSMGLLPVHALRNGLSAEQGALFVGALAIGNAIFQIPLGLLSDRFDRRRLLVLVAATTMLGALILSPLTGSLLFVFVLVVWSGLASGLYMLGLGELGARYKDADLAAANATFVVAYASGMLVGPPAFGRAMDISARNGLFGAIAVMVALLLVLLIARSRKH